MSIVKSKTLHSVQIVIKVNLCIKYIHFFIDLTPTE